MFSDSNNIFLWYESEDINKNAYFQNFSWFQFYVFKLCMIMCVSLFPQTTVLNKEASLKIALIRGLSFQTEMISA